MHTLLPELRVSTVDKRCNDGYGISYVAGNSNAPSAIGTYWLSNRLTAIFMAPKPT